MMRDWNRWGFCFFVLALIGCAADGDRAGVTVAEIPGAPGFALLAETGPIPRSLPFGVLVALGPEPRQCSVAHVKPGKVVTAAHCVRATGAQSRTPLAGLFLVAVDRRGQALVTEPSNLTLAPDVEKNDVALLEIGSDVAASWATLETLSPGATSVRGAFRVTAWAFDPLALRPDLAPRVGSWGAVLKPRHCLASRTSPEAMGVAPWSGEPLIDARVSPAKARAKGALFLDGCDSPFLEGNSGAVITKDGPRGAGAPPVAIYHSTAVPSEAQLKEFSEFSYRGNDGVQRTIPREWARMGLYDLGTLITVLPWR